MNITETPVSTIWPKTHYAYIEKIGPFLETAPSAWTKLHELIPTILENNKIEKYFTLFKVEEQIYRAGISLADIPRDLPGDVTYTLFPGGKYAKFVMTGSFAELAEGDGRVFELVAEQKIQLTDNFCIEHYLTDPTITPEFENIVEMLVPIG